MNESWLKPVNEGGFGIAKIKLLFGSNIDDLDDFYDIINNGNSTIYNFLKLE